MSEEEFRGIFGKPFSEEIRADGTVDLTYFWATPISDKAVVISVGGLTAQFLDHRLVKWQPIYTKTSPPVKTSEPSIALDGRLSVPSKTPPHTRTKLVFHVVSKEPISGGVFVDTQEFPKLGYIRALPDLEIVHLQDVSLDVYPVIDLTGERMSSPGTGESVARLSVVLALQDTNRMHSFSSENLGNQVLILVNDEIIAAPRLLQPSQDQWFQITTSNTNKAEKIYRQLKLLAK